MLHASPNVMAKGGQIYRQAEGQQDTLHIRHLHDGNHHYSWDETGGNSPPSAGCWMILN